MSFTPPPASYEQSFRDKLMADTKKSDAGKADKSAQQIIHLPHLSIDDKPAHIDKVVEVPLDAEDGDIIIE